MTRNSLWYFFTHRISLNVYFFYPFVRFRYTGEHTLTIEEVIFYILLYGSILYINNLLLLPKFLKSRSFKEYALILIPILISVAFFESYMNKTVLKTCECEGPNSTYVIYNFIHLGSMVVIFAAVHVFRKYNANLREYEKSENLRLESELKFLRSQVNPHLLFNSLNSIYSYALDNSDRVPSMLIKLSELLRYMLYECDKPFVKLENEVAYLKDYINLQQMRYEDIEVDFKEIGDSDNVKIAPMILITFLENAFKYASLCEVEKVKINIRLTLNQEALMFEIDNPFEESDQKKGNIPSESSGFGVQNAKTLLQMSYPDRHSLSIEKRRNRFFVQLKMNLAQ